MKALRVLGPEFLLLAPLALWVGQELVAGRADRARASELEAKLQSARAQLARCEADAAADEPASDPDPSTRAATPIEVESKCTDGAAPAGGATGLIELPGAFAFLREDRVVLATDLLVDPKTPTSGSLHGDVTGLEGSYWVEAELAWSQLEGFEWLEGSHLDLYGESGVVCHVRTRPPHLRVEVEGELGLDWEPEKLQSWQEWIEGQWAGDGANKRHDEGAGSDPIEVEMMARLLSLEPAHLEAEFEVLDGDCAGALWARASALPRPALWQTLPSQEARELELVRLRESSEFRDAHEAFDRALAQGALGFEGEDWTQHVAETLELQRWQAPDGRVLTAVALGETIECGGPDTRVELQRWQGALREGPGVFDALFSLGGADYGLQVRGDATYLRRLGPSLDEDETQPDAVVLRHELPFYGCPC